MQEKDQLNKHIAELVKEQQAVNKTVVETEAQLKKEQDNNTHLVEKLRGSEQQVLSERKQEEKRVAELQKYIGEEQRSKIIMNNEMKAKVNELTQSMKTQKDQYSSSLNQE
jgi:uncharacterized coiled-coil protein SlyX